MINSCPSGLGQAQQSDSDQGDSGGDKFGTVQFFAQDYHADQKGKDDAAFAQRGDEGDGGLGEGPHHQRVSPEGRGPAEKEHTPLACRVTSRSTVGDLIARKPAITVALPMASQP